MLHAKPRPSCAPDPVKLLDVQLSALIFLLARCIHRPFDGASAQLALDHLEMARTGQQCVGLTACLWCRRCESDDRDHRTKYEQESLHD